MMPLKIVLFFLLTPALGHPQAIVTEQPFFLPSLGDIPEIVKSHLLNLQDCYGVVNQFRVLYAQYEGLKSKKSKADPAIPRGQQLKFLESTLDPYIKNHPVQDCATLTNGDGSQKHYLVSAETLGTSRTPAWNMEVTIGPMEKGVIDVKAEYRVGQETIPSPAFDFFVTSAAKKFGQPVITVREMQNGYGAVWTVRGAAWSLENGAQLLITEGDDRTERPIYFHLGAKGSSQTAIANPFARR